MKIIETLEKYNKKWNIPKEWDIRKIHYELGLGAGENIPITKEQFEEICKITESDVIIFNNKFYTFGELLGDYHLIKIGKPECIIKDLNCRQNQSFFGFVN